jgi:hypothetical protein
MSRLEWGRTFACCALLWSAPARAQEEASAIEGLIDEIFEADADLAPADPAAQRSAMARALFSEGLAHAEQAHFERAADLFQRAYALRPAPAIAYNLASALAHMGRFIEATELLEWVVRDVETRPAMRAAAQATIDQLSPRLARAHIVLAGPREGLVLLLDGMPLTFAAVGVEVPIDPGSHRLEAMRGDARVAVREVDVEEGGRAHIDLEVPMPREAEPPVPVVVAPPPRPEPAPDFTWLAWSGGALAAVIVAAVVTGIVLAELAVAAPVIGNTSPAFLEWR